MQNQTLYLPQESQLYKSRHMQAMEEAMRYYVDVVIDGGSILDTAKFFGLDDYVLTEVKRELIKAEQALKALEEAQNTFDWDMTDEMKEIQGIKQELERLVR